MIRSVKNEKPMHIQALSFNDISKLLLQITDVGRWYRAHTYNNIEMQNNFIENLRPTGKTKLRDMYLATKFDDDEGIERAFCEEIVNILESEKINLNEMKSLPQEKYRLIDKNGIAFTREEIKNGKPDANGKLIMPVPLC